MLPSALRHVRVCFTAILMGVSMTLATPALAACDTNIGHVEFPLISVVGDGVEYTHVEAVGYGWNAKLDVVCGVFGRVRDWEIIPVIQIQGIGNLSFSPYGASASYPIGARPKEVHWNEGVIFPSLFVKAYAVAACNLNADLLRESGFSDADIFSKEHKIAVQHWMLASIGYSNTREVGRVGFFGPGFGDLICKRREDPQAGVPDELEVDTEMELLGASLVLFPSRYEGSCPKDMSLFASVRGNLRGNVEVWIESTAGWQSDKGMLETSQFHDLSGSWVGEIDERLEIPLVLPSPPPPDSVVPPSPATGLALPPNEPGGSTPPTGPDWFPELSGEGAAGNVHADSLRLVARAGGRTIASEWQGYRYTCDPKPVVDVPSTQLDAPDEVRSDGSESTGTPGVFSERTREVGTDRLTQDELAQLSRALEFIRAAELPSAADPDCIVHDDGSITCLKEDAWICWCDAPDTPGGECGCANF